MTTKDMPWEGTESPDNGDWKEATGSIWKPENKGDQIIGLLVDIQTGVGENNSTLYTVQTKDTGENLGVWGSAVLDSRMKGIGVGQEVKITYQGLGDKKPGKNPPKLWTVHHREPVSE